MSSSSTAQGEATGWGIDWSSWKVRSTYLAMAVGWSLCSSLCVVTATVIIGSILGPKESGALFAGVAAVGALAALCFGLARWMRARIGDGEDFGRVALVASKIDFGWFIAWTLVVALLPLLITVPIFQSLELRPFSGSYTLLFGSFLAIGLHPFAVMVLRGPEAPPLRTPRADDESRQVKRTESGLLVYAFAILFILFAAVGTLLVYFTSRLA